MSQERYYKIVLSPFMSEKAVIATEKRREYAFKVAKDATKPEVKKAIEMLFNTKVDAVRIVNMRAKVKQFRGLQGKRKGWKKAYVTLAVDQKIDLGVMQ